MDSPFIETSLGEEDTKSSFSRQEHQVVSLSSQLHLGKLSCDLKGFFETESFCKILLISVQF